MRTLKEDFFDNLGIGEESQICDWLKEHNIRNYTINKNLTIDVRGDVDLKDKNITNLPDYIQFNEVLGDFNISKNPIISLKGCPKKIIYGNFNCSFCEKLKSLKYSPKEIGFIFYCKGCDSLKTLDGITQRFTGGNPSINCSDCKNLNILRGLPKSLNASIICKNTNVCSLQGFPKYINGDVILKNCKVIFTEEEINNYCTVNGKIELK